MEHLALLRLNYLRISKKMAFALVSGVAVYTVVKVLPIEDHSYH